MRKRAFTNLKLTTRINLGFGVILGLLVLLSAVNQFSLQRAKQAFEEGTATSAYATEILDIDRNTVELQRSVLAYVFSGYEGLIDRVERSQQRLEGQLEAVWRQLADARERDVHRRMTEHFRLYRENFGFAREERRLRDRLVENGIKAPGKEIAATLEFLHQEPMVESPVAHGRFTELERNFRLVERAIVQFNEAPDSTHVRNARRHLAKLRELLAQVPPPADPGARARFERLPRLLEDYENAFVRSVQATRAYLHLVYVVMAGEAAEIGYLAEELKTLALRRQQAASARMEHTVRDARVGNLFLFALAFVFGILAAVWIGRNTAEPIKRMTRTLTALANGSTEAMIPDQDRTDEVGAMANAAQVFKEHADELKNANRYKSEFLANMSHELRTPLNSLLILARLLVSNREGNLSASQVESTRVIHDSGRDLLSLINDILDLSKVEAGRMELVPERMALDDLVISLERQFLHVAEDRGLRFEVAREHATPEALVSDWGKVEQILRNLLSNAFKFTSRGGIRVRVGRPAEAAAFLNPNLNPTNCLAIAVTDSGIGIPADKRRQIFEAFRQVDGTTSRKYGGTGLGLTISRKLAALLGGELQVESELEQGSTFTLYLPWTCPAATGEVREVALQDRQEPELPNFLAESRVVLVVDDDERNRFALRQILEAQVGQVLEASDGEQALALLRERDPPPDAVLMDIMMPVMDGYQATRAIRADERLRALPVIALTAHIMPGDREKCLAAGADHYLGKPVAPHELLTTLAECFAASASRDHLGEAIEDLPSAESVTAPPAEEALVIEPPLVDHVLIVSDDMRTAFVLAKSLETVAKQVCIAQDRAKAQEKLKQPGMDVLLVDLAMPEGEGMRLLEQMDARATSDALFIIALLPAADPALTSRALAAGAHRCLPRGSDGDGVAKLLREPRN